MKLADWLVHTSKTPSVLRRSLGVERSSIHRYLTGSRIPSPRILQRIIELTDGQVQLADFLDPTPPECAIVLMTPTGTRWVLPWSADYLDHKAAAEDEDDGDVSTPLLRALRVLGTRASLTKRGVFLLDGSVSDAKRIVTAANKVLIANDQSPIAYPGVEVRS